MFLTGDSTLNTGLNNVISKHILNDQTCIEQEGWT